jgi:hypothetical protein
MNRRRRRRTLAIAAVLACAVAVALAQRRGLFNGVGEEPTVQNADYDGRFTSVRLQMIINYNTDISQFWEWSGRGLRPIDETNETYKLGVNYVIYGLTH